MATIDHGGHLTKSKLRPFPFRLPGLAHYCTAYDQITGNGGSDLRARACLYCLFIFLPTSVLLTTCVRQQSTLQAATQDEMT